MKQLLETMLNTCSTIWDSCAQGVKQLEESCHASVKAEVSYAVSMQSTTFNTSCSHPSSVAAVPPCCTLALFLSTRLGAMIKSSTRQANKCVYRWAAKKHKQGKGQL